MNEYMFRTICDVEGCENPPQVFNGEDESALCWVHLFEKYDLPEG